MINGMTFTFYLLYFCMCILEVIKITFQKAFIVRSTRRPSLGTSSLALSWRRWHSMVIFLVTMNTVGRSVIYRGGVEERRDRHCRGGGRLVR